MIQQGRLTATKKAGRWVIDSADLPQSEGQASAKERKERQMRAAVDEALDLPKQGSESKRYSVRDLKAFQLAQPLYLSAIQTLSKDQPWF